MVYAETKLTGEGYVLEVVVIALRDGFEYFVAHNMLPIILETD